MNGSLSPSLVRTFVPFLVGFVGSFLARHGLNINDDALSAVLVLVIGYLYYVVARFLEVYGSAKWGYILGVAKAPGYSPGDAPVGAPVGSDKPA